MFKRDRIVLLMVVPSIPVRQRQLRLRPRRERVLTPELLLVDPVSWYHIPLGSPGVWANVSADPSGSGPIYSGLVGGGVRKSCLALHAAGVFSTPTTSGVFKTTDGGASWSPVSPALIPLSLGTDPHIPGRVFAGNLSGPILRSLDGGVSWARVRRPGCRTDLNSDLPRFHKAGSGQAPVSAALCACGLVFKTHPQ
jgi:hypothetical protein